MFDFTQTMTKTKLQEFAEILKSLSRQIGFKVSSRGWCYIMEQSGYINKDQFDKVESAVNRCRKLGFVPVDFVAENDARKFVNVEEKSERTIAQTLRWMLSDVIQGHRYYTPDWWEGEEFYIQVVVEKVDLKTLFEDVCAEYHIPVANAAGWQSILQRAEYAKRFKQAEKMGLKCVLLYCGDHDPDGLRISETIRKNLRQVKDVLWNDGTIGYDPKSLIIKRFGLNYDFIIENDYSWIDNLITGSGKNLSSPKHKNYRLPYVQEYLQEIGARKCEANAVVTTPDKARALMRQSIEEFVGSDALQRFEMKTEEVERKYKAQLAELDLLESIRVAINTLSEQDTEDSRSKLSFEDDRRVPNCTICESTDTEFLDEDEEEWYCNDCGVCFDENGEAE